MLSFIGVLLLGTVNGVIVGCALSFWEVSVNDILSAIKDDTRQVIVGVRGSGKTVLMTS